MLLPKKAPNVLSEDGILIFKKIGKLKSIDRKRNSRHNNGRRAVVPFWGEDEQLNAMKRIVDNYPELYLDEIQYHLLAATGKWASPTSSTNTSTIPYV